MPDTAWTTTILPSFLGFLAGVGGSFIAPWVSWGIEKRRMKVQHRRELVTHWRTLLHDVSEAKVTASEATRYSPLKSLVQGHPHFPSLQPHLREETLSLLANTASEFWSTDNTKIAYDALLKDVNAAEKTWDLV